MERRIKSEIITQTQLTGEIITPIVKSRSRWRPALNQMEIDMFVEIHDYLANRTAAVEVYLGAKAQFDKAETTLKGAKKDVVDIVNGYGFIEGDTADLDIALQARKSIDEKLLLQFLTQEQIDACKVEGVAFPVVRIKAKKVRKAA